MFSQIPAWSELAASAPQSPRWLAVAGRSGHPGARSGGRPTPRAGRLRRRAESRLCSITVPGSAKQAAANRPGSV